MTLTDRDVYDAFYALQTNRRARIKHVTPPALIQAGAITQRELDERIAQYERGSALLREYIVLVSAPSAAEPTFHVATQARVVSPIITVLDYIGMTGARRAVALAKREN